MAAFLSWVWSQAEKIYLWFGAAFWVLYEGAVNAWNWAVQQAALAYQNAVNYAYRLVADFRSDLSSFIDWVSFKLMQIRNDLLDDMRSLTDWVEWKLSGIAARFTPLLQALQQTIYSFINSVPPAIRSFIQNLLDGLKSNIIGTFQWLLDARSKIMELLAIMTPASITLILQFISRWLSTIINFFQNPLTFILDLLQPVFISFLCYVLAWGLGTTSRELPSGRSWRRE